MTVDEVMAELEKLGTEQNRKVFRRHGAGDNLFGVSIANVRKLAKRIGKDPALAEALWRTRNYDARILALLVADPRKIAGRTLDVWARSIDNYVHAEMLAGELAGKSPLLREKAEEWTASDREYVGQAGWNLVAILAMKDGELDDDYFGSYLGTIENTIGDAKNRVRHAMNSALIAIGLRNEALRAQAEAVATRIGKVEVDHGQTGCVTPDAIAYIEKSWARKKSA